MKVDVYHKVYFVWQKIFFIILENIAPSLMLLNSQIESNSNYTISIYLFKRKDKCEILVTSTITNLMYLQNMLRKIVHECHNCYFNHIMQG